MLSNRPLSSLFNETGKCIAFGLVFNDWQIKRLLCLEIRCVGHAELENIVGCRHFVRITNALLYAINPGQWLQIPVQKGHRLIDLQ